MIGFRYQNVPQITDPPSRLAAQITSKPENIVDQTVGIDDQTKESQ